MERRCTACVSRSSLSGNQRKTVGVSTLMGPYPNLCMLDEEVEEEELFWKQDALKEEENDTNYEEEPEIADEFDSDFDDDEPEPDEEA